MPSHNYIGFIAFWKYTWSEVPFLSSHTGKSHVHITEHVKTDHFVKVMSASFLHCKVNYFFFV